MTDLIESTLRRLSGQLPGRTSRPGDERYATATAIWAKPVGLMPRMVVHCRTIPDIQLAIAAARSAGLALSVRGGGHDWACRALCDGLVLDLFRYHARNIVAAIESAPQGCFQTIAEIGATTQTIT